MIISHSRRRRVLLGLCTAAALLGAAASANAATPVSDYISAVKDDNPSAYWRLEETSGATTADASGNGHAGTFTGSAVKGVSAVMTDDNRGEGDAVLTSKAVRFPWGAGVSVDDSSKALAFAGNQAFTLEAWVRPDALDGTYRRIIAREVAGSGGSSGYALWVRSSQIGVGRTVDGVSDTAYANATAGTTPEWAVGKAVHVVATYDGTTLRLYLNGKQADAKTSTRSLPDVAGTVRLAGADGSSYLNGALDEVAVYPSALSADRVDTHFLNGVHWAPGYTDWHDGQYKRMIVVKRPSGFTDADQYTVNIDGATFQVSGGDTSWDTGLDAIALPSALAEGTHIMKVTTPNATVLAPRLIGKDTVTPTGTPQVVNAGDPASPTVTATWSNVSDSLSGLPYLRVTATDVKTMETREYRLSGENGSFTLPALPIGMHTVMFYVSDRAANTLQTGTVAIVGEDAAAAPVSFFSTDDWWFGSDFDLITYDEATVPGEDNPRSVVRLLPGVGKSWTHTRWIVMQGTCTVSVQRRYPSITDAAATPPAVTLNELGAPTPVPLSTGESGWHTDTITLNVGAERKNRNIAIVHSTGRSMDIGNMTVSCTP